MSVETKKLKTANPAAALWQLLQTALASRFFRYLTFLWFIIEAFYMAISTRPLLPPDEDYHLGLINLFTKNGWLPFIHNQSGFYSLGEVVHTPFFLYHYLLSLPNHLFIGSDHAIYYLRFINVAFGVITLTLIYRLARSIKLSPAIANLSVFMMANTLMFVFLNASVNYDNLFNLLAVGSVLALVSFIEKRTLLRALVLADLLLSGLFIKINFLPIAFITLVILFVRFRKDFRVLPRALRLSAGKSKKWNIVLSVIFILLGLLFLQRYGVNTVRYHTFSPRCTQTLTIYQCRQNHVFARNERISNSVRPPATKGLLAYTDGWLGFMAQRTYGLFTPRTVLPATFIRAGSAVFLILGAVAVIRWYRLKDKTLSILLAISLFYIIVLMATNHHTYKKSGSLDFTVQGRYWFAVLPLFYLIGNAYIWKLLRSSYLKILYALIILISFTTAGLPTYIYKTDSTWHTKPTTRLNANIKNFLSKIPK